LFCLLFSIIVVTTKLPIIAKAVIVNISVKYWLILKVLLAVRLEAGVGKETLAGCGVSIGAGEGVEVCRGLVVVATVDGLGVT